MYLVSHKNVTFFWAKSLFKRLKTLLMKINVKVFMNIEYAFVLEVFQLKNFWMVFGSKMCWKFYKFKPLNLQLFPGSKMRNIILTSIIEGLISLTFSNISSFNFKPTKETNYYNDRWWLELKFQNICSNIFQKK